MVFFYAAWCPNFRATVAELNARFDEVNPDITLVVADYGKEAALMGKFGVTYQDTFVLLDALGNGIKSWNSGGFDGLNANCAGSTPMLVTIGFAFLAGVITVLSPCVLPLLPVILGSAAQEGRARPIGLILGLVAAFTAATLALSYLVRSLGVAPDLNRILAGTVLILLGLVLALPPLHRGFVRLASALVSRTRMPQNSSGFGGGLAVGAGLGLAWSPCAGAIMASVITLALNQQVDAGALAITLAFSLGTALPMAAIMLGGRQLTRRLGWFQANAARIQQVMGLILVVTGLAIFLVWDRQIQIILLTWFPDWELALTSWEPLPVR